MEANPQIYPRPFSLLQKLAIVAVALFGLWMYSPALQLPPSLIDDYAELKNMDRWAADYQAGGLKYAVQHDIGIAQEVYNTGFWFIENLRNRLNGGHPFHWLILAELAFVCFMLFSCVRLVGQKRRASFWAGICFVVIFFAAEVPGAADLQALRVNWYRLYATDQLALDFLTVFIYSIARIILLGQNEKTNVPAQAAWAILASFMAIIAFTIKLPFVALTVIPLFGLIVAAFIIKQKRLAVWCGIIAVMVLLAFVAYNVILRRLHIEKPGSSYGDSFSLKPAHIWQGFTYYLKAYWGMYGPLFPAICAAWPWALYTAWHDRYKQHRLLFLCLIFTIIFTVCAAGIYLPWNSRLPRYMLVGVFGFNLIAGLVVTLALQTMSQVWRTGKLWLLLIIAGLAVTLLPPVIVILVAVAAGTLALFRYSRAGVPLLSGMSSVGIIYILAVAPAVRTAANYVYIHRENSNWEMTLTLLKYSAKTRNVCFAGNIVDEHLSSMAGHITRMGVQPRLYPTTDKAHCGLGSLLLIHNWLSPPGSAAAIGNRRLIKEIGALPGKIPVPVSFWEFRGRMDKSPSMEDMVNYWQTEFIWRLYD